MWLIVVEQVPPSIPLMVLPLLESWWKAWMSVEGDGVLENPVEALKAQLSAISAPWRRSFSGYIKRRGRRHLQEYLDDVIEMRGKTQTVAQGTYRPRGKFVYLWHSEVQSQRTVAKTLEDKDSLYSLRQELWRLVFMTLSRHTLTFTSEGSQFLECNSPKILINKTERLSYLRRVYYPRFQLKCSSLKNKLRTSQ